MPFKRLYSRLHARGVRATFGESCSDYAALGGRILQPEAGEIRPIRVPIVPGNRKRSSKTSESGLNFVPLRILKVGIMKKDARKFRRIFRLQRKVKYGGTRPGPSPEVFLLAVPRDVVEAMHLRAGDVYRFHALGGILTYEPMGAR